MSHPSIHPKQRPHESSATVSRMHMYSIFCTC
jgi:hypothetical protein